MVTLRANYLRLVSPKNLVHLPKISSVVGRPELSREWGQEWEQMGMRVENGPG